MTLSTKSKANRNNAKLSTGPVSKAGKLIAKSNALKHGANAKGFINASEEDAYQSFLKELQEAYPSNDPLIKMYLDRIAKARVHADRIQKTINAIYAASEIGPASDEILMDFLGMDAGQKKVAENIAAGDLDLSELPNQERISVATELAQFDISSFSSHEEFLQRTPLLCGLLFNEANEYKTDINSYIENDLEATVNLLGWRKEIYKKLTVVSNRNHQRDIEDSYDFSKPAPPKPSVENTIPKVKLSNLHRAANIYKNEINRLGDIHYKVLAFNQLRQAERNPVAIDYGHLDSLQRYMTTSQNLLSKLVGELISMMK